MKKIISMLVMVFIFAGVIQGNSVAAKTTEFNKTKIDMKYSEHNMPMSIRSNGDICMYQYEDDGYNAVNDEHYYNVYKYICDGNSIEIPIKIYECHDDYVNYVEEIDNGNKTVVASKINKGVLRFVTFNEEGKVVSSIEDEFDNAGNVNICDLIVESDKIYYTYIRYERINKKLVERIFIKCINNKTGEVLSNKLLGKTKNSNVIKMDDKRVYVIKGDTVESYKLNGKKNTTYKLPKVKRRYRQSISICGKYLYYTNGKNGIYRCNINKAKKGFSLYYNTKKDSYFNKKRFYDFCVKDSGTIFARFMEGIEDYGDPTILVKYSK